MPDIDAAGGLAHDRDPFVLLGEAIMPLDDQVVAEIRLLRSELTAGLSEMRREIVDVNKGFWGEVRRIDQTIRGDDQYQGILGRLQELEANKVRPDRIESLERDRDQLRRDQSERKGQMAMIKVGLFVALFTSMLQLLPLAFSGLRYLLK